MAKTHISNIRSSDQWSMLKRTETVCIVLKDEGKTIISAICVSLHGLESFSLFHSQKPCRCTRPASVWTLYSLIHQLFSRQYPLGRTKMKRTWTNRGDARPVVLVSRGLERADDTKNLAVYFRIKGTPSNHSSGVPQD